MLELLKKCNQNAVVKMHYKDGEQISRVILAGKCIILETYTGANCLPVTFTVSKLVDYLTEQSNNAEIVMHTENNPALFVVSYERIPDVVVIEDADDNDLTSELDARFEYAAEKQVDELDFFMDMLDTGFTLEDIKKTPSRKIPIF